jgi:hypothetical protein
LHLIAGCALLGLVLVATGTSAQIPLTSFVAPNVQDFNTLAASGTSSAMPAGWAFLESGTNANLIYTAGNGGSGTGDTYSFGALGVTERAFGGLQSSSLAPTIGAAFLNSPLLDNVINSLSISYTGEQWRLGAINRVDRLDFQYSLDATSLDTGIWIDVDALDFVAPVTSGATGALDGNAAPNRTTVSGAIGGLDLAVGGIIWIRWVDLNATGADDGLAIDDFSIRPEAVVTTGESTWGGIKSRYH